MGGIQQAPTLMDATIYFDIPFSPAKMSVHCIFILSVIGMAVGPWFLLKEDYSQMFNCTSIAGNGTFWPVYQLKHQLDDGSHSNWLS